MKLDLKIKLEENGRIPTRGSSDAAGQDLYADLTDNVRAAEDLENQCKYVAIPPYDSIPISTGVSMAIPKGYFGAIYARSGLACKRGLRPANCTGIIDSDYRGIVTVWLYNDSAFEQTVYDGDRIAQLIIQPYQEVQIWETDKLDDTERGDSGFGSTGAR